MKKLIILAMATAAVGANAVVFNVDAGGLIPDLTTTNFTFTLSSAITNITDMNVRISGRHTWDADVAFTLIAPDATTLSLIANRGGSGDNWQDTLLDDSAGTAISAGVAPFIGSYRPEGFLSTMNGKSANGVWTLRVVDSVGGDSGALFKAGDAAPWGTAVGTQLIVEGTPEPATMAALGLGVAALLRRRKK